MRSNVERHARTVQTVLGLIWLLDGGLQFQSFMYSKAFVPFLQAAAAGQPGWVSSSVDWGSNIAGSNLTIFNTLFALTQVAIGLGLLFRPTVKPALALSVVWALVVWWFGESFGQLFSASASPLTGAPGAALLYCVLALIAWPSERPGGLLGARAVKFFWAGLWLVMAWMWLLPGNSSSGATAAAINAAPSGMSWLSQIQDWAAQAAGGLGVPIAFALAAASVVIAIGVSTGWQARRLLVLSVVLNVLYWVLGQGLGGIFMGGATDPNAGPLFVLLAYAIAGVVEEQATVRKVTMQGKSVAKRGFARKLGIAGAIGGTAVLLAGCAAADKPSAMSASTTMSTSTTGSMAGMKMSGGSMSGMNMSSGSMASDSGAASSNAVAEELKSVPSIDGIKPVPTQLVGSATWQGMRITAQLMTPVPFVVFNGTSAQEIKPTKKTSFHLMVMLNDAQTGVPIPYASVWATIRLHGRVVFDEQQWAMLSRYMGPHYGNDVSLPGAGHYQLSILVDPPVAARHLEYQNVWLHPHRVQMSFNWKPLS
jgi:hypothetical protein